MPLVAAVQGNAVGVGTTMLLHCDHVVAGSDARFSTPFVGLGLVPEAASSLLAPRLMGHARAFSLLVMGRPLDAEEAKAAGLVNTVVAPDAVEAEAMKAAREIAALPPQGVLAARRLMRGSPDEIVARIDEEAELFKTRLQSAEARSCVRGLYDAKALDAKRFSPASICLRCGSRNGGSTSVSPSFSSGSSTAKPGPSVAISNRMPFGSRKYSERNQ